MADQTETQEHTRVNSAELRPEEEQADLPSQEVAAPGGQDAPQPIQASLQSSQAHTTNDEGYGPVQTDIPTGVQAASVHVTAAGDGGTEAAYEARQVAPFVKHPHT